MPKKKRDPNEMSDRDLLKEVFPERVIVRIEEELLPEHDTNADRKPPLQKE